MIFFPLMRGMMGCRGRIHIHAADGILGHDMRDGMMMFVRLLCHAVPDARVKGLDTMSDGGNATYA